MSLVRADDLEASTELVDVVRLLQSTDGLEPTSTVSQMLSFAAAHPDALHRTCERGHFTGSSAVIDPSTGSLLVLFHRKAQRWLQPGGHADGDANLARVALREAIEETGIEGLRVWPAPVDVDIHEVRFPDAPPHLHLDVRFVIVAPSGATVSGNHESEALRWVRRDELVGLDADSSLHRLAGKALALAAGLG